MTLSNRIVLTGRLICADAVERDIVKRFLADHIDETRAETGCLSFSVEPTTDIGIWLVAEEFVDQAAFEAHQQRVAASAWGRATAAIRRDYTIS